MVTCADFRGQLVVVTGAGSGIGRELAAQLVAAEARVALCDIRGAAAKRTRAEILKRWPAAQVSAHTCDVTDESGLVRFRSQVESEHDSTAVNILINNAGAVGGGSFVADDRKEWERTFEVNWAGAYRTCRIFLPMLMVADRGVVVNIASVNALWASVGQGVAHTAYSTAKFALRGFTESLIDDFAIHAPHLSAVLVMPGHVRTSMPAPPPSWRRALHSQFASYKPVTAAEAASQILKGILEGEWRIVIGEDARRVDELVREDPWGAYSPQ